LKKSHQEDTVGPWAEQKLDALESYLKAYMNVMKNQRFRLVFVDAFAGAGGSKIRGTGDGDDPALLSLLDDEEVIDEEQFIAGSPIRALSLEGVS
jgi:three-Cys-motif partner protein